MNPQGRPVYFGTRAPAREADLFSDIIYLYRYQKNKKAYPLKCANIRIAQEKPGFSGRSYSLRPLRYPSLKSSAAFSTPLTVLPVTSPTVEHPAPKKAPRQTNTTHFFHMKTSTPSARPQQNGTRLTQFCFCGRLTCRKGPPPSSRQTRHDPLGVPHVWWSDSPTAQP